MLRFRVKREQLERFEAILPESQIKILFWIVLPGYLARKKTPTPLGTP